MNQWGNVWVIHKPVQWCMVQWDDVLSSVVMYWPVLSAVWVMYGPVG